MKKCEKRKKKSQKKARGNTLVFFYCRCDVVRHKQSVVNQKKIQKNLKKVLTLCVKCDIILLSVGKRSYPLIDRKDIDK